MEVSRAFYSNIAPRRHVRLYNIILCRMETTATFFPKIESVRASSTTALSVTLSFRMPSNVDRRDVVKPNSGPYYFLHSACVGNNLYYYNYIISVTYCYYYCYNTYDVNVSRWNVARKLLIIISPPFSTTE